MPVRFAFERACVRQLAGQRRMQQALASTADAVAAAARSADPRGNYHAAPVVTRLASLDRAGWRVQDTTADATRREFGSARRAGNRTLGRLSGRVR